MLKTNITIIGFGNMGNAFLKGLLLNGLVDAKKLTVSNRSVDKIKKLKKRGIKTYQNNKTAVKNADIVILAVKPDKIKTVCSEIRTCLKKDVLIISVAAGVKIQCLEAWLRNNNQSVARVMPNTPLRINQAVSGWTTSTNTTQKQKNLVKKILRSFGEEIYFKDESMLDQVTAISGCGPAYLFYIVECLERAAHEIGLTRKEAKKLIYHTLLGSSLLLLQSKKGAKELRQEVTSKGGVTESAIKEFEKQRLKEKIIKGIQKAFTKSQNLITEQ